MAQNRKQFDIREDEPQYTPESASGRDLAAFSTLYSIRLRYVPACPKLTSASDPSVRCRTGNVCPRTESSVLLHRRY
jgi:hypothetical protein